MTRRKSKAKAKVLANAATSNYPIVRKCFKEHGCKMTSDTEKWDVFWSDTEEVLKRNCRLTPFQVVNHFPGMASICRKDFLGNNLEMMRKQMPAAYSFSPQTWMLPRDMEALRCVMEAAKNKKQPSGKKKVKTLIVKPRNEAQGNGIMLIQDLSGLDPTDQVVVQEYISRPLLLDGFKFDCRVYVVVTSVSPLTAYLYKDGLARLCTTAYVKPTKANLKKTRMHLTNFSINGRSRSFAHSSAEDEGSKRSLAAVLQGIEDEGLGPDIEGLWRRIASVVVKTLLAVQPQMAEAYQSFFGVSAGVLQQKKASVVVGAGAAEGMVAEAGAEAGAPCKAAPSAGKDGTSAGSDPRRHTGAASTAASSENQDPQVATGKKDAPGKHCFHKSNCFEVLGFDVMFDAKLQPWLIEVNSAPSFKGGSKLDTRVKTEVIGEALELIGTLDSEAKNKFLKAERKAWKKRLWSGQGPWYMKTASKGDEAAKGGTSGGAKGGLAHSSSSVSVGSASARRSTTGGRRTRESVIADGSSERLNASSPGSSVPRLPSVHKSTSSLSLSSAAESTVGSVSLERSSPPPALRPPSSGSTGGGVRFARRQGGPSPRKSAREHSRRMPAGRRTSSPVPGLPAPAGVGARSSDSEGCLQSADCTSKVEEAAVELTAEEARMDEVHLGPMITENFCRICPLALHEAPDESSDDESSDGGAEQGRPEEEAGGVADSAPSSADCESQSHAESGFQAFLEGAFPASPAASSDVVDSGDDEVASSDDEDEDPEQDPPVCVVSEQQMTELLRQIQEASLKNMPCHLRRDSKHSGLQRRNTIAEEVASRHASTTRTARSTF